MAGTTAKFKVGEAVKVVGAPTQGVITQVKEQPLGSGTWMYEVKRAAGALGTYFEAQLQRGVAGVKP